MHTPQNASPIPALPALNGTDGRSAKILAKTIFRDMRNYGIPAQRILEVASELIHLVTEEITSDDIIPPKV
jgi:hypothetical protein